MIAHNSNTNMMETGNPAFSQSKPIIVATGSQPLAVSPLLQIEQVASDLGTTCLDVMRLISKSFLTATQIGNVWRVTSAAEAAYVAAGCTGFSGPKFADRWFLNEEQRPADAFIGAFWKAAAEQYVKTAAEAAAMVAENAKAALPVAEQKKFNEAAMVQAARGFNLEVPLLVTGKLAEAINAPPAIPAAAFKPDPALSKLRTAAEAYLVSELRKFAFQIVSKATGNSKSPLERLYSGPAEYAAIRDAALSKLQASKLSASTMFHHPASSVSPIRISYSLNVAALTSNWGRVAALAF